MPMIVEPVNQDSFTLLAAHAAARPDAPFVVFEDDGGDITEITYERQVIRAESTAAYLAANGVKDGSRVHLMTTNRPVFLDVMFGCARLGAVLVPVNPLSSTHEVAYQLAQSRAMLSVVQPELRDIVPSAGEVSVVTTDDIMTARPVAPTPVNPRPKSGLAAIMFTSGTTSRPKGVRITHANYLRVGAAIRDALRVNVDDR